MEIQSEIETKRSRKAETDKRKIELDSSGKKKLYYLLLKTRMLDERLRKLFKQGRFAGTYFSAVGQEATTVVPTFFLRKEDVIAPSHREIGASVAKGVPIKYILYL